MGVTTTADEKREELNSSIDDLISEVIALANDARDNAIWGSEDLNEDNLDKAYIKLKEVKKLI